MTNGNNFLGRSVVEKEENHYEIEQQAALDLSTTRTIDRPSPTNTSIELPSCDELDRLANLIPPTTAERFLAYITPATRFPEQGILCHFGDDCSTTNGNTSPSPSKDDSASSPQGTSHSGSHLDAVPILQTRLPAPLDLRLDFGPACCHHSNLLPRSSTPSPQSLLPPSPFNPPTRLTTTTFEDRGPSTSTTTPTLTREAANSLLALCRSDSPSSSTHSSLLDDATEVIGRHLPSPLPADIAQIVAEGPWCSSCPMHTGGPDATPGSA